MNNRSDIVMSCRAEIVKYSTYFCELLRGKGEAGLILLLIDNLLGLHAHRPAHTQS